MCKNVKIQVVMDISEKHFRSTEKIFEKHKKMLAKRVPFG